MSNTNTHRRMYRERQGETANDGVESRRYGNRRHELARLKVKERRRERKAEQRLLQKDTDSVSAQPIKKQRPPWG